jgi:hypothetical protein
VADQLDEAPLQGKLHASKLHAKRPAGGARPLLSKGAPPDNAGDGIAIPARRGANQLTRFAR